MQLKDDGKRGHTMRFCEDKAADQERARAAVAEWREQDPAGTQDQLKAALGTQFHPDYGPCSARCCSRSTSAPCCPTPGN